MAEKLGISVHTVREWFADNGHAEILDEIVPLWHNIGCACQFTLRPASMGDPSYV